MLSRNLKSILAATLIGSASLLTLSASAQTAKAPFTYKDLVSLDRISGLSVDGTGRYAVFQVRATDLDKNKGVSAIWLKDLSKPATPEIKLAASEGGAASPKFSADGNTIYFLSARSGSM